VSEPTAGEDGGGAAARDDDGVTMITFAGAGFGTIQIERAVGSEPSPPAVSGRRHLRDNLPGIYGEGDFGMRFVGALEAVLDLLTAWLGLEHDEARSGEERRMIVRMAPELMRRRGTREGLELALSLAFPGVPLRVEDGGSVTWSLEDGDADAEPAAPSFVVYCDVPLPEQRLAAVARLIEQAKPAHVGYRLRVRASKPRDGDGS
jgi:hypothetical protein